MHKLIRIAQAHTRVDRVASCAFVSTCRLLFCRLAFLFRSLSRGLRITA
jgi:hypothetical protein